ncbi:MAG: serine hydrolase [Polyangiaceae bacterium]
MRCVWLVLGLLAASGCHDDAASRNVDRGSPTKVSAPHDSRFDDITAWAEEAHSPSGAILVDGKTIFSWGDVTQKLEIHSCRKSFLSALIGIAVDKKQIDLARTLDSLGIDDEPPSLTPEEKQATILDLLEARSGIYHEAANETPSMKAGRPARGSHPHGSLWFYNNWDFNALGGIYEQLTHTSIFDAFDAQIAKPIGMQDYAPADGFYSRMKTSRFPGYLFHMSTRDLARFGQLYLQRGNWNGVQVVPEAWVAASVTSQSQTKPGAQSGYGYLWWTAGDGTGLFRDVDLGAGAFAAEGFGGHYVIVAPRFKLVVVTRADDAWYLADPETHNIGPNRTGKLLRLALAAAGVKPN